jgi:hypothetical protein
MPAARLILIAAPELIPALRERVGDDENVLTFADSEPLRALEAITVQRPGIVALERLFAASPRGAALIARIKADPTLEHSEIRVLSHDSNYQRVSPRKNARAVARTFNARLDRGTRRAPRFRIRDGVQVSIDDQLASLVDLSVVGAQVASTAALKPKQQVEIKLGASAQLEVSGFVVWAKLELTRSGPTYRAGIEFTRADAPSLASFCETNSK